MQESMWMKSRMGDPIGFLRSMKRHWQLGKEEEEGNKWKSSVGKRYKQAIEGKGTHLSNGIKIFMRSRKGNQANPWSARVVKGLSLKKKKKERQTKKIIEFFKYT